MIDINGLQMTYKQFKKIHYSRTKLFLLDTLSKSETVNDAARKSGLEPSNFRRLMRKYGIDQYQLNTERDDICPF